MSEGELRDASGDKGVTPVTRRRFLKRGAIAVGGAAVVAAEVGAVGPAGRAAAAAATKKAATPYKPVALDGEELKTLTSVLSRLFPADSLGPGAVEMDVQIFIDKALATADRELLPAYQGLLPMFDAAAKAAGAESFTALSPAKQDKVLKGFEAGKVAGVTASAEALSGSFQMLLNHMREGLFADPMYGGNKGLEGWKLIGYPGVNLNWSAETQKLGAKVPTSGASAETYGGKPFNGPYVA